MNVAVMKTKAEQAVIEQFDAVADRLPGAGWVPAARRAALGAFAAEGLPHRRIEEWKYTDLRALLKTVPKPAPAGAVQLSETALAAALGPELSALECARLVFVNGRLVGDVPAVAGVHVGGLAGAIGKPGYGWMVPHFATADGAAADKILALNTAFVTDGALIRIEDGTDVARLIHIVHVCDGAEALAVTVRNLIQVGEGARCTILESYVSANPAAHLTNAVTEIEVGDRAEVSHIKQLAAGSTATHVGSWHVRLGAAASYRGFHAVANTALARNQIFATYAGQHTKLDLSGVFLARDDQHIDTTLVVDHAVPHCESRELFKGVLDDRARGIFQGKIIVRPDAQKTDGKQMAQVLMLSPEAEFDSKPELEIYADDVVCGHGSTSAELDDDLIFYCQARGIPPDEAKALLTSAFVGEAIDKIAHEGVREALGAAAERWLREGHSS